MEETFSGYCRRQDGARIVLVEREPGGQAEIDCDYRVCEYAGGCPIGRRSAELLQENEQK